ncbi:MAG: ABC-type uncharacterized transport system permease subunit [Alphaproteobacteria bacterium]|jgi:ABC-type uncharacterized transport system permease subunit
MQMLILNLAALAALTAFVAVAFTTSSVAPAQPARLWLVLLVALAGTGAVVWVDFDAGWRVGFAPALWLTIIVTLAFFGLGTLKCPALARLAPMLAPYLLILGVIATIWAQALGQAQTGSATTAWLGLHIVVSVSTYALFTLAAVAGGAVFIQERALKARRPTRLTGLLPAIAEAENLQRVLMSLAAAVLGLGLVSGMVIEYLETSRLMAINHKTVFALVAFAVIVVLIAIERASGLAGRRAARALLVAYLFLTLAYPGVKFVTDVIIAGR